MSSKDLRVTLSGVTLDNPVIPASGTYGFGQEFTPYYDINILGSLSFKGTTAESRFGNPTPRIAECPNGMLNSVGLQNPGVEHVIAHELPALRKIFHKPIIANISGFSVEEYVHCVELLTKVRDLRLSQTELRHTGGPIPSTPHLDMTVDVLRDSGIEVFTFPQDAGPVRPGHPAVRWLVLPGVPDVGNVEVEPDLSNAGPFLAGRHAQEAVHLDTLRAALPALALQELPLLQQDVVGIEALDALAGLLASTGGPV